MYTRAIGLRHHRFHFLSLSLLYENNTLEQNAVRKFLRLKLVSI